MDENKPVNRRAFFREGLRELLKPLAQAIEPLHEAARQLERLDAENAPPAAPGAKATPSGRPMPRAIPLNLPLRPPGALPEAEFKSTCERGGECVRACPAQCIKIDPTGIRGGGAPYIDADDMPCVVCDGLYCMQVCPSGALVPTMRTAIDMGLAVWHADTCVRTKGDDCTLCVDRCPIGTFAIDLIDNEIVVKEAGCIGCGVCQEACPTTPKSIVVVPKSILS